MFNFIRRLFSKNEETYVYDIKLVKEIEKYLTYIKKMDTKSIPNYKKLNKDIINFERYYKEVKRINHNQNIDAYYGGTFPIIFSDYETLETFKSLCIKLHKKLYTIVKNSDEYIKM